MPQRATEDQVRRIYRETLDDFYGVVSRRCEGDRALTEDIVQETWLRAVRAWQSDGIPDRPMAWLVTVASRLLSNHFRKHADARLDETDDAVLVDHEAERRDANERRSLVERALARLPALQMRLIEAFHFDRHKVADIARTHGISERAVEGRLRRARQNLRQQIEADTSHEDTI